MHCCWVPGCACGLPVSWSVVTAAVRPTPEDPLPLVEMASGATDMMARRSWDLATEGSPTIIMFRSLKGQRRRTHGRG